MMIARLVVGMVLILCWTPSFATVVDTGRTHGEVESWRDLQPVKLDVSGLKEMLEKSNLYQPRFYNELHLAFADSLEAAGIVLLPESEWQQYPEAPSLTLTGKYSGRSENISLYLSTTLTQIARVTREAFKSDYWVTTWSASQSFPIGHEKQLWRNTYHAVLRFVWHTTRAFREGNAERP